MAMAETTAVEPSSELGNLGDTLSQIHERIQALGNRVRVVNGRVFADNQDSAKEPGPKPVRAGQIGVLQDRLEEVHDALGELDNEIGRIERL